MMKGLFRKHILRATEGFPGGTSSKEPTCHLQETKEKWVWALGWEDSLEEFPGGGQGNPLQYSCLENPMDRGAWQAAVRGVGQSQTRLRWLSMHAHMHWGQSTYPEIKI